MTTKHAPRQARKRARRKEEGYIRVEVNLGPDDLAVIDLACKFYGCSRASAIRAAIDIWEEKYGERARLG